jgi:hypothetical protein
MKPEDLAAAMAGMMADRKAEAAQAAGDGFPVRGA